MVKGNKWTAQLYGFAEFDAMRDSIQSFADPAGNSVIARSNSYAGTHGRWMQGMRNSRFGFRLGAPEVNGIKVSGQVEVDFIGNQPGNPPSAAVSEAAFFQNPTMRARHYIVKIESPVLDFMFGQYWQLFGWQTYFHPASVEIQGLPGQVFVRSPQARVSKSIKSDAVTVDLALAASRAPQRDAGLPDGQGGLRLLVNGLKALHTMGGAATASDAGGIGVSGVLRQFALPELVMAPDATTRVHKTSGWGISVDALIPIVPATLDNRANGLTLTGSFVTGSGIADLYTGLTGGIAVPAYPGGTYAAPIDAGLVQFDPATGRVHTIDWRTYMVGLQYYLPPSGQIFIAANYSHASSSNIASYLSATSLQQVGLFRRQPVLGRDAGGAVGRRVRVLPADARHRREQPQLPRPAVGLDHLLTAGPRRCATISAVGNRGRDSAR